MTHCPSFQGVQVSEQTSVLSDSRSRSSSITSWDSQRGNAPSSPSSREQSSVRYSAPLCQGEMQQELVVTAVRMRKKKRRSRRGKCADKQTDGQKG